MTYDIVRIVEYKDTFWDLDMYHIEYLDENGNWILIKDSESMILSKSSKDFVKEQAWSLLEYDE